ncbi:hypothetical protein BDB00DRAFT_840319 [Zychaea mexicana]|uniref:uncharacterized protein n=1 Tax=Zychaea mexicana TaxID=64656 RepID=UPI0022FE2880|nr:uncharacterized protein BDB00DRAFT_840319 [Zychaea mexicana]KAI9489972.1 hypothetical protein BDB00DRAFT_840319 [Zychaea mexicana]
MTNMRSRAFSGERGGRGKWCYKMVGGAPLRSQSDLWTWFNMMPNLVWARYVFFGVYYLLNCLNAHLHHHCIEQRAPSASKREKMEVCCKIANCLLFRSFEVSAK